MAFDNLQPHLCHRVTATIQRAGANVLRLPPYSSDYTPIEEMWSKAKQYLRRAAREFAQSSTMQLESR